MRGAGYTKLGVVYEGERLSRNPNRLLVPSIHSPPKVWAPTAFEFDNLKLRPRALASAVLNRKF